METKGNEPINAVVEDNNYDGQLVREAHYYGLTKREYIAVAVLNGLISAWGAHDVTNYAELSHDAVMAADALISVLNASNKEAEG